MTEQEIMNITLKKGDVLCEIDVLDKLGLLETTDLAKARTVAKVIKISKTNSFDENHTIKLDDYLLLPKFHQITDKIFKTLNKEFVIVNDQDIVCILKKAK